MKLGILKLPF